MNKEIKECIIILLAIWIITPTIIYFILANCKNTYEFVVNNEKFISNKCYIKDEVPVCEYNGNVVEVDYYSEVEK